MPYEVLDSEPRYRITELVSEIVGRRDDAIRLMDEQLKKLVVGIVDQLAAMKKHNPDLSLASVSFERIRWTRDGRIVVDIFHNKRPFTPAHAAWD